MVRVLLAGATGLVGGEVLKLLLADDRVRQVVTPTRRPLPPAPKLLNPIIATGEMPRDAEWWSVDGAICALGTTRAQAGSAAAFRKIDYDLALAVAARAREGGASRFALTSAAGANAHSFLLYPRVKGELEEAVRRLGFASLTIVRPGFLDGTRTENRPTERRVGAILRFLAPILPLRARVSPARTVAAMLVAAAIDGVPGHHLIGAGEIAAAAQGQG